MGPRWFSWIFTLENKGVSNDFWFSHSSLRRSTNVTPLIHACILQVPQTATITAYLGAPCMSSLAAMGHLPTDTGTLTRLNLGLQLPIRTVEVNTGAGSGGKRGWGRRGGGGCSGRGVQLGETRGREFSPSSALMTTDHSESPWCWSSRGSRRWCWWWSCGWCGRYRSVCSPSQLSSVTSLLYPAFQFAIPAKHYHSFGLRLFSRLSVCVCVYLCVLAAQSCLTLCNPMDYSPPGSSVHGILQARILEQVAISLSGDLSNLGIKPGASAQQAHSLLSEPLACWKGPVDVWELD